MARLVIEISGRNAEQQLKALDKAAKKFGGTTKRMGTEVDKADKGLKRLGRQSQVLRGNIAKLGLAIGVAGLTGALRGATRAAIEQAQAEAQLAQGIASTGGAAGQSADELIKMAAGLQQVTTFGDEAIIRAQSILLTFTKIKDETFPQTTEAVLDLAARMGSDLSAAAVQLGKALNDPVANLGELGRAGIQFSKEQKAVIKAHFEGGEAAKAQALILEELTRQFGGSAKAAARAAGGGYKQAAEAFGDISEGIGSAFLPALDAAGRDTAKLGGTLAGLGKILVNVLVPFTFMSEVSAKVADHFDELRGEGDDLKKGFTQLANDGEILANVIISDADALAALEAAMAPDRLQANIEAVGAQMRALSAAMKLARADFEAAQQAAEQLFEHGEDIIAQMEQRVEAARLAAEALASIVPEFEIIMPGEAGPPPAEQGKMFGEEFGQSMGIAVAGLLSDAILDPDGVSWVDVGATLGATIGFAMGGPIGAIVGNTIGSLAGGLLGGGSKGPSAFDIFTQQFDALAGSLSNVLTEIEDALRDIGDLLQATQAAGQDITQTIELAGEKVRSLRDELLGIDIEDFGNRLRAALTLNQGIGLGVIDIPGTGGGLEGGAGTGRDDGGSGEAGQGLTALAPTLEEVSAAAADFNDILTEEVGSFGEAGINLSAFAGQLVAEFAGVSFEFLSVQASATDLRVAIEEMGFSAEETARLLAEVTEIEAMRMEQLRIDALAPLLDMMIRFGVFEEEARQEQAEILRIQAELDLKLIEAQLIALGVMDDTIRAWIDALEQAIADFDFSVDVGGIGSIDIGNVGGGGGGRGRGRGRGDMHAEREQAARDMQNLIDTLNDLASEPAFNTLNDRMRELRETFFGEGGFADEARRLGVDMALVNAAFRQQRMNLIDEANQGIRRFLEALGTSAFNPGGAGARFGAAQDSFDRLLRAAQGGDLNARAELGGAAQTLLDLAQQRFGNTRRFRRIFEEVQGSLSDLLGDGATTIDGRKIELAERQVELLEIIAGVGTTPNVTFFDAADRAAAEEIKRLRMDQAQAREFLARERRREHDEAQKERAALRAEVGGISLDRPTLVRQGRVGRL